MPGIAEIALGAAPIAGGALLGAVAGNLKAPDVPPPAYYAPLPEDPPTSPPPPPPPGSNVSGCIGYNGRWVHASGCN